MTGEVLVTPLPDFGGHNSGPRNEDVEVSNTTTYIYPNPFDKYLNIYADALTAPTVVITDLTGRTMFNRAIDSITEIDTKDWPVGIYLVTLYDDAQIVRQEKVVLTR